MRELVDICKYVNIWYMKGEIIYKVLGFLENCALDQIDFISASLESGYGASMGKLNKKLESKKHSREAEKIKKQKIRDFQKYFSKLKKDGLISVNANEKVSLSEKGKKKLNSLRKNSLKCLKERSRGQSDNNQL